MRGRKDGMLLSDVLEVVKPTCSSIEAGFLSFLCAKKFSSALRCGNGTLFMHFLPFHVAFVLSVAIQSCCLQTQGESKKSLGNAIRAQFGDV